MRTNSLLVLALAAGCSNPDLVALEDAEAVWADAAVGDYAYDVAYSCFCPEMSAHVEVVSGSATVTQTGEQDAPADLTTGVPGLLDRVRTAIEGDPASLEVTYDPSYGFPASVSVDPIGNAIDDEWGFTVSSFGVL